MEAITAVAVSPDGSIGDRAAERWKSCGLITAALLPIRWSCPTPTCCPGPYGQPRRLVLSERCSASFTHPIYTCNKDTQTRLKNSFRDLNHEALAMKWFPSAMKQVTCSGHMLRSHAQHLWAGFSCLAGRDSQVVCMRHVARVHRYYNHTVSTRLSLFLW